MSQSQFNTTTSLTGLFKDTYGDDIINLVAESMKLIRMVKFVQADQMPGNLYHQPVIVAQEHGFSYAAANAGAFALANSISSQMQDAQVAGAQMVLRSAIDYESAARASSGGVRAFRKATELLVQNMMDSISKRLEHQLLYGQNGLGVLSAGLSSGVGTFTAASWCPGLWGGTVNAECDIWSTVATSATQRNSTTLVITAVNLDSNVRTVTFSGTTSGTTSGDVVYWRGARAASTYAEMAGLDKIITNAGQLFNIDASVYELWAGTTLSSTGTLTLAKIMNGVSKAVERGLSEDVVVLVSPRAFQVLNSDQSMLREYNAAGGTAENGFKGITFTGPNGKVEVVQHLFVRDGDAYIVPPKRCRRIGATDITFNTPGRDGEIFLQLPSNAGFELRAYSNQAVFAETPARLVKLTGITYPV